MSEDIHHTGRQRRRISNKHISSISGEDIQYWVIREPENEYFQAENKQITEDKEVAGVVDWVHEEGFLVVVGHFIQKTQVEEGYAHVEGRQSQHEGVQVGPPLWGQDHEVEVDGQQEQQDAREDERVRVALLVVVVVSKRKPPVVSMPPIIFVLFPTIPIVPGVQILLIIVSIRWGRYIPGILILIIVCWRIVWIVPWVCIGLSIIVC